MLFLRYLLVAVATIAAPATTPSPPTSATYQETSSCDAALYPTQEAYTSNYRLLQAHMRLNAEYEYSRLKMMTQQQREAEASYKLFAAEYENSTSSSEFRERVISRLETENYNFDESQSRAYTRQGPTAQQMQAWTTCQQQRSGGGYIIVTTERTSASRDPFAITMAWRFPEGHPADRQYVDLELVGGTTAGVSRKRLELSGSGRTSLPVTPNASANAVLVIANLNNAGTDQLYVDLTSPPRISRVQVTRECEENENCNHLKAVACLSRGSVDAPNAVWMHTPDSPEFPAASHTAWAISYGPWFNRNCTQAGDPRPAGSTVEPMSGTGWSASYGSCTVGLFHDRQHPCQRVRVIAEEWRAD